MCAWPLAQEPGLAPPHVPPVPGTGKFPEPARPTGINRLPPSSPRGGPFSAPLRKLPFLVDSPKALWILHREGEALPGASGQLQPGPA